MELVFSGEFPPVKGGIGSYLYSRCQSPPPDGLRVLAARSAGSDGWDATSELDIRRFPYRHGSKLALRARQAWWAERTLRGEVRRQGYRVVTANVVFPFGWVAARTKRAGHRVAMFCHGAELLSAHRSTLGRWVYRTTIPRVDLFIANSLMTADTLVSQGCDHSRICVIPPPVDTGRFHPAVNGEELRRKWTQNGSQGPVLLTICRLQGFAKGVDTVLGVLPRLRQRFPQIRYVVVGDGRRRKDLEAMARQLGVDRQVVFTGRISDEELPQCYAACDAFVLLSRRIPEIGYYEGFGIVYREAMACGKPVIVSTEAGFRDYVVDGENGVLTSPTDAEEIVRVCTDLLSDPAAAAEMGRRAVVFASESADWSPLNELA